MKGKTTTGSDWEQSIALGSKSEEQVRQEEDARKATKDREQAARQEERMYNILREAEEAFQHIWKLGLDNKGVSLNPLTGTSTGLSHGDASVLLRLADGKLDLVVDGKPSRVNFQDILMPAARKGIWLFFGDKKDEAVRIKDFLGRAVTSWAGQHGIIRKV